METKIEGLAGRADAWGCVMHRLVITKKNTKTERYGNVAPSIREKPSNATGSCKATVACIGNDFFNIKLSILASCNH
jgi:hypothetical protein